MAIEKTTLLNEVNAMIDSGPTEAHYFYEFSLLAGEERISPYRVESIDIVRQYLSDYSDTIVITVVFPLGIYMNRVYPYKDNLVANIFRNAIGEMSTEVNAEKDITTQVYRAILIETGDPQMEHNYPAVGNEDDADISNLVTIQFQLIDQALEYLRLKTVGGIIRQTNPGSVVKGILTQQSRNLPIEVESGVYGVEMVNPDNQEIRDHIIIPHGTKLVDLPQYVQDKCGGVYSSGMGVYLQTGYWYVYPELNTDRANKTPRVLTVFNIPANRFPHIERTYRRTSNQVIIISTGNVKHKDDSETVQLNQGNGVRFTDSRTLFDEVGKTANNRTTITRNKNNTEVRANQRRSGLDNVQVADQRFTNNTFAEMSKLARRFGQFIQLTWHNSNPSLIKPGMPTKFYYIKDDQVVEVNGVVVGAHHYIELNGQGIEQRRHVTNSSITLFVEHLRY